MTMKMPGIIYVVGLFLLASSLQAAEEATLEQIKAAAAAQSKYLSTNSHPASNDAPKADLEGFRTEIEPALKEACYKCHGSETAEGDFRVDTLDPDLLHGEDVNWWLDVMDVLSNGEMPPADEDVKIADADRGKVIDWLSRQVLVASQVKRSEGAHSSFRRMTRYEFSYALQDLFGLSQDFATDLVGSNKSADVQKR
jgi:mono/diheme cytochrome c family protein